MSRARPSGLLSAPSCLSSARGVPVSGSTSSTPERPSRARSAERPRAGGAGAAAAAARLSKNGFASAAPEPRPGAADAGADSAPRTSRAATKTAGRIAITPLPLVQDRRAPYCSARERPATRGDRSRVELVQARRLHVGRARRPRVVAADRRDSRGGARRRGPRRRGRAAARADGARARDDRAVRPLLPRHRHRRRAPGGHLRDPRRDQPEGVPEVGAQPLGTRGRGALAGGGGPLRLPRGGQLDHARRRRRPRPRRRLDAAHPCRGPQRRWTCAHGRSAPCA